MFLRDAKTLIVFLGTDRNNMVQVSSRQLNYPLPFEASNLWNNSKIKWIYHGEQVGASHLAINVASSGYYR